MKKETTHKRSRRSLWITLGAAAACVGIAGGIIAMNRNSLGVTAYAEALYPKMTGYPDESDGIGGDFESWWEDRRAQREQPEGYADDLWGFYGDSVGQFLSADRNSAYSPVNLYMALSALAETCDGDSRRQILDLLGAESIESLRTQSGQVWNANYCNDGALTSVLANSLWIADGMQYNRDTISVLAKDHYASVYSGKFGTQEMDKAIQNWLNEQTGGFLKDAVAGVSPSPETVFALYSTVYFKARWNDEFDKALNTQGVFHAPGGDVEREFMNKTQTWGRYCYGEDFGAVQLGFKTGCGMWLILPDEDKDVNAVLDSGEYLQMIKEPNNWSKVKSLRINLSLPKFDVSSDFDLKSGLSELGVTDVFSPELADFSPICDDPLVVGKAKQSARVQIDEEGCTAASFVEMEVCGAAMPPEEEMDLTFDRPFIFVITGMDGQPLFAGTVCEP